MRYEITETHPRTGRPMNVSVYIESGENDRSVLSAISQAAYKLETGGTGQLSQRAIEGYLIFSRNKKMRDILGGDRREVVGLSLEDQKLRITKTRESEYCINAFVYERDGGDTIKLLEKARQELQ